MGFVYLYHDAATTNKLMSAMTSKTLTEMKWPKKQFEKRWRVNDKIFSGKDDHSNAIAGTTYFCINSPSHIKK